VIDQIAFDKMRQTGGNFITGPSQDQFKIVGQTLPIPEIVVVAGPSADPELTAKLKEYLLTKVKDDQMVCRQLGLQGFAPPDREAYEAVGKLLH
jgi:ABC-type phosphate/phosphonate transport system substrate-binding protein